MKINFWPKLENTVANNSQKLEFNNFFLENLEVLKRIKLNNPNLINFKEQSV